MSIKNPRNLIVVGVVVAALLAGTVLLGGYANSKTVVTETEAPAKACQAEKADVSCPATAKANQDAFAQVYAQVQTETVSSEAGSTEAGCEEECSKPCCADKPADGCCGSSKSTGCSAGGADSDT